MIHQRHADDVQESAHLDAWQPRIGVIDFGCVGKLTDTDIRCFTSPPIARVFHSSFCEPKSDTMLSPHGFSCASIITGARREVNFFDMGEDEIEGVYPSAQLYTYAIGCGRWLGPIISFDNTLNERCLPSTELVTKAIDQAVKDKVKVISMSIAERVKIFHNMKHRQNDNVGKWTLYAYGQGVLTCTAMGNDGPIGESAIYGWPWGITVGAQTSEEVLIANIEIAIKEYVPSIEVLETIDYKNEKIFITHRLQGYSFNMFETEFLTLRVGNDENWSQERILFRDESACSLLPPEPMLRNETLTPKVHSDSMVLISKDDVSQLHTLHTNLLGKSIFVRIFKSKYVKDERGFFVPQFSARGPSRLYEEHITPDLVAPGYAICMSHPSSIPILSYGEPGRDLFSNHTIDSGTSFACPHVAACAIAVWSAHPKWKPSAVKSALITTAMSFAKRSRPGNEFTYGAGSIDLESARRPGLVYEESYDCFVDYFNGKREIYDLNLATFAASFSYSHKKCVRKFKRKVKEVNLGEGKELGYTYEVIYFNRTLDPNVTITVEPPYLKFTPGEEKEFVMSVEIQPHEGKELYVSAMLKWNPDDKGQSVRSPIHLYHHTMIDEPIWYEKWPEIH